MIQNLWDSAKAILGGKFIAIQSYLKKQEKSQINNLTLHIKQLEKEEQKNPPNWQRGKIQQRNGNFKKILEIIEQRNIIPEMPKNPWTNQG